MFTYQNKSKYCESNPNHGYSNHFYINNNCKYCRCEKTYTININKNIYYDITKNICYDISKNICYDKQNAK